MANRAAPVLILSALLGGSMACSSEPADDSAAPDGATDVTPLAPLSVDPGFYLYESAPIQLLADGDPVTIRLASQGGYVMFVGARVGGLEPGFARLAAELVNPETNEVFVSDSRTVQFVAATDGSDAVEPDARDVSQFAHLLPCPNYGFRTVHGLPWLLNVTVGEPGVTSSGSSARTVIPMCAEGPRYENCVCECQPEYFFGKCGAPH